MKKITAFLFLTFIILISILIMIIPTFQTTSISRTVLKQELNLPLILNDAKEIKLIFFGYSGCLDICSPRLKTLNNFYTTLSKEQREKVGVEFLDISIPHNIEQSIINGFDSPL